MDAVREFLAEMGFSMIWRRDGEEWFHSDNLRVCLSPDEVQIIAFSGPALCVAWQMTVNTGVPASIMCKTIRAAWYGRWDHKRGSQRYSPPVRG